ncbi:unnamed protein product, partial [Dibothriocephalus latus]
MSNQSAAANQKRRKYRSGDWVDIVGMADNTRNLVLGFFRGSWDETQPESPPTQAKATVSKRSRPTFFTEGEVGLAGDEQQQQQQEK